MTCSVCGARCHGNRCADCKREQHMWEDDVTGGESDSSDSTQTLYECGECGHTYFAQSLGECPHKDCDSHRARMVSNLEASA